MVRLTKPGERFWTWLDELVTGATVEVDRPRGSRHPEWAEVVYPYDYGYLEGTRSGDAREIDVWIGSDPRRALDGVICTFDQKKRDLEVKLLLGCRPDEREAILAFHNHSRGWQAAILIDRREG